jgi:hypothetical protein
LKGSACRNGCCDRDLNLSVGDYGVTRNGVCTVYKDSVYWYVVEVVELKRKIDEEVRPQWDGCIANHLELGVDTRKGIKTTR